MNSTIPGFANGGLEIFADFRMSTLGLVLERIELDGFFQANGG